MATLRKVAKPPQVGGAGLRGRFRRKAAGGHKVPGKKKAF
jgi:hypothetical protein